MYKGCSKDQGHWWNIKLEGRFVVLLECSHLINSLTFGIVKAKIPQSENKNPENPTLCPAFLRYTHVSPRSSPNLGKDQPPAKIIVPRDRSKRSIIHHINFNPKEPNWHLCLSSYNWSPLSVHVSWWGIFSSYSSPVSLFFFFLFIRGESFSQLLKWIKNICQFYRLN